MQARTLALPAVFIPSLFAAVLVTVTALEWDFLHERLDWSARPLDNPDAPWPSILALGDYGILVSLAFLVLGLSVIALALALFRMLGFRKKMGPVLLLLSGVGASLAVIRTDYRTAYGGGPDTWNGNVNAIAYSIFVPAAVVSMLALAARFRRDPRWHTMSGRSAFLGFVALAGIVAFLSSFANVFFWIYLAATLVWLTLVSLHVLHGE